MDGIQDLRARADKNALEELNAHVGVFNTFLDKCVGNAVALESTALMSQLGAVAEQVTTLARMVKQMALDADDDAVPPAA